MYWTSIHTSHGACLQQQEKRPWQLPSCKVSLKTLLGNVVVVKYYGSKSKVKHSTCTFWDYTLHNYTIPSGCRCKRIFPHLLSPGLQSIDHLAIQRKETSSFISLDIRNLSRSHLITVNRCRCVSAGSSQTLGLRRMLIVCWLMYLWGFSLSFIQVRVAEQVKL